jgi:hypothetical protein
MVHYPPEMFGGKDIGELYDITADPDETRNLYHDAAHQAVVADGRTRLLNHLIGNTRVTTIWPPVGIVSEYDYQTAEDGKEANTAGTRLRVEKNQLGYI